MRITVHATPRARRQQVGGQHDGALRIAVTAPADKGRANRALVKALAGALGVAPAQIELISGKTSRRKVFRVSDPPAELAARVAELLQIR